MSIAVSVYDALAFTVPGFLYLFVFNELLRTLGYSNLEVGKADFSSYWLPMILLAYVTGQLMDFISLRLWVRLWYRVPDEERAYNKFLTIRADEKVDFNPKQWAILFTVIQREDRPTAEMIDRSIAVRVLLRNISFGLFIFSLLYFYLTFYSTFSPHHLIEAVCLLIFSFVSLQKSDYYNILLYCHMFQHATLYGKNLQEVLNAVRTEKPKKSSSKL